MKLKFYLKEMLSEILNLKWKEKPQKGTGTFHYVSDLPKQFLGWDKNIVSEISRLKKIADNKDG